jgi:PAS domain S-box-containing protein
MAHNAANFKSDLVVTAEPTSSGLGPVVALLLSTVLFFAVFEFWNAWDDERRGAIDELTTVVELEAVAVDAYLSRVQTDLETFGNSLRSPANKINLDLALVMARKLNKAQPELSGFSVIEPNGNLLFTSDRGREPLPASLASEPSFMEAIRTFEQGASTNIGEPTVSLSQKLAFVPMRYAVRNPQGDLLFVVSASMPHEHLQSFWRNAPITTRASIGIVLDNGYLISRYPVQPNKSLQEVYGQVRSGAMIQYLRLNNFPTQGTVQGRANLEQHEALAAFRRLSNHRLTLFIMMPMSEIWQKWRDRVGLSLVSLLLLLAGISGAYCLLLTRQRQARLARRAGELALAESEAYFRLIMDASGDGIWDVNLQTHSYYFNPNYYRMLGYEPDAFPASRHAGIELLHPLDQPGVLAKFQEWIENSHEPHQLEFRMKMRDGSWAWIRDRAFVIERDAHNRALRIIGTHQDITAQKRIEHELSESELRFRGIFESAGSVMLLVESGSEIIIEANQAAAVFYGYPNAILTAMTVEQLTHRQAQQEVSDWGQLAMDNNLQYVISRHQLASGEVRDVEIYSTSIPFKGIPVDFYIVNDITERKTSADLLRTATSEAERANNAKSRFLAAASHDLRQPLTALGLYLEVLKSRSGYADDKLQANLSTCTANLGELLTDLLDISKLQAGVVVPEPRHFSASDLLSRLVAIHTPSAQDKGLRLRWRPCSTEAYADEVLLTRIVGNLVANSIRYTQQGGVLISCRRHQGKTWIEVWDSGIGIPQDKTEEIFEEYHQLNPNNPSRSSGSIGSGLGLAIVAKTAALMGLQIRVHSRIGKGSLFAVELPLGAHAPTPRQPILRQQPLRIALVEDNAGVLDALSCALQSRGHQVVAAATGAELLSRLGNIAPDVIVSDYRLRDGEIGTNVTEAVMQAFGKRLPVLIVTGDTDPEVLRDLRSKADLVLNKPLNFEQLLASIAQLGAEKE